MADQNTNKDILERVSELPDDLRKALFASTTTEAIKEVGKKYGLMIDKIGELAQETGRVMMGIAPPTDYVKNLTARLGVPQEKAKAIAEEINQKVFQPVRESLKRVHGLAKEEPKPMPPPQPKPLPTIADLGIGRLPKKEEIASYVEEIKAKIPPIFVKNVPQPTASQLGGQALPDIMPEKSIVAKGELEKDLGQPIPPTPFPPEQKYQIKDPYRELIE